MTPKFLRTNLGALVLAFGVSFMFSCSDDDNGGDARDCNAFAKAVQEETSDWTAALLSEDCEQIEDAYNGLIDAYKDAMPLKNISKI